MGLVVQFPKPFRQRYIPSLGCFQTEEVDYRRILSEYQVVSDPGEKLVVHVPIRHNPPSEDDTHAIMSILTHLMSTHEGRLFMPVGLTTGETERQYVIREY